MGMYLNPGNEEFRMILKDDYQDKTGLAAVINARIDRGRGLICISRPRRFGKSYAAKMLCAYYDHTCDSHELFDGRDISTDASYETHLNQYQVIYLDMTNLLGKVEPNKLVRFIEESIESEIAEYYPDLKMGKSFDQTLLKAVEYTRTSDNSNPKKSTMRKFIMIIDEWDAPIRETPEITEDYLNFLRMLFKSSGTTGKIFAAAYMTGILPIKKTKGQSAVSDFDEFSIIEPLEFAPYTGFNEAEVRNICTENGMDFDEAKRWYDGYTIGGSQSVYNPYSVMKAVHSRKFKSYWKKTSASENLEILISINMDGLQEDVLKLIAGEELQVDTEDFNNDFENLVTKDDVLTLLIHLGYLSYDDDTKRARIPNEEIRTEFNKLLKFKKHTQLVSLIRSSEKLLADTFAGNGDAVAEAIKRIRETNYAPTHYNNEQSLRYAVKFAYIICVDRYLKVEELPSGKGLADVVYLPKRDTALPAMVVELKWNESADSAIEQIKNRNYPAILQDYVGEIILVGINYNENTNEHTCKIERVNK